MDMQFKYIDLNEFLLLINGRNQIGGYRDLVTLTRLKHGKSTIRRSCIRAVENIKQARNLLNAWLESQGYVLIRSNVEYVALRDCDNKYVLACVYFTLSDNTIDVKIHGDSDEVDRIVGWVETTFAVLGSDIQTAIDLDDNGNIIFSQKYMTNSSAMVAKQSFYPWLTVTLEDYFKAFMESDESILVLFGPPGTGKSTFLRSLIVSGNYSTILAYNKKVVESSALVNRFYRTNDAILAYEDIDNYLKSREDGNQLMSSLLNASDGVVKHSKKKIVFSTNLPSIDRIDPALLRVGRCFDILQFRELTQDEAAIAARDADIAQKDWTIQREWPLAKVLSKENTAQQVTNRFAKKVGFGR